MVICKDLDEVRDNIDRIDEQIVKLIAERSTYVTQAALFKKTAEDVKAPERVERIIEKMRRLAKENNLNPNIIEGIYRDMINAFINMEMVDHKDLQGK